MKRIILFLLALLLTACAASASKPTPEPTLAEKTPSAPAETAVPEAAPASEAVLQTAEPPAPTQA